MFTYSIVQLARRHAARLDRPLRHALVNMYKPMMRMPCIFHRWVERWLRKWRTLSVLIEVENAEGMEAVAKAERDHFRMKVRHHFRHVPFYSARVTPAAIEQLLEHPKVKKVYLNRQVKALLNLTFRTLPTKIGRIFCVHRRMNP